MSVFAGFSKTFNQNVWNIKGFQKKKKKWVIPKFLASKSPLNDVIIKSHNKSWAAFGCQMTFRWSFSRLRITYLKKIL